MKIFSTLIVLCAVYSIQGKSVVHYEDIDSGLLISDEPQPDFTFIASQEELGPQVGVSPAYVEKNTHFNLWTRRNPTEYKELKTGNRAILEQSGYDGSKPTKIFAHGFQMNGRDNELVLKMRDEYLKREDCNFIAVDWEILASAPNYFRAVSCTSPVGVLTGQLVNFLVEEGANLKDFHVIGFSLGAHVAGQTGATVDGSVPRITGLDPAYPDYSLQDTKHRLDTSDAEFVDVIHTNSGSLFTAALSFPQAIGHADFFVNGGHSQPGCGIIVSGGITDLIGACSHDRSVEYFIESINSKVGFKSLFCDTWKHFTHKRCSSDITDLMGEPIDEKVKGTFYLTTNSKSPFAMKL